MSPELHAYNSVPSATYLPARSRQEILENTPSRQHGLSAEQEQAMMRTAINMIIGAGAKLQMDIFAVATATIYLQRYYLIKSLLKNDYFIVSIACLYLAGKVEDTPKSVRDVLYACFEWRFRGQQDVLRRLYDKDFYDSARERVFTAERAIMYALGFDFNIESVYGPMLGIIKEGPVRRIRDSLAAVEPVKVEQMMRTFFILANDSLKTTLCLQYSAHQIAATVIWLVLTLYRLDADVLDEHGRVWWVAYEATPEVLEDISGQILSLYEPVQLGAEAGAAKQAAQQQQYATAQHVMQGVLDGQLTLYATHTLSAEQHLKLHPPPQPPADVQQNGAAAGPPPLLPQQPSGVPAAGQQEAEGLTATRPGGQPAGAAPAATNQLAAAVGPPAESFDEYDELFS
ncbi:hypothetical protein N2152v2_010014 [Parachlorella kessleri]